MRSALLILFMAAATSCGGGKTISGYADRSAVFRLAEVDGVTFSASATISFPEEGRIAGQAPCNTYSASQSAPYPWFAPGPIAATRRACADLDAETVFFEALAEMTLVEALGDTLLLTNEAGREMVFGRVQD